MKKYLSEIKSELIALAVMWIIATIIIMVL